MGISGLLPFLQKCSKKVDMSEFSGCTAAVDVYCWLHKGVFSCAEKVARGEDTDQYVQYCMKFVNMLLSHKVRPILVFDGCHLPAKAETEKTRRERREFTKKKACELLRSDKVSEAKQMLRRCVDITHTMAHKLITRARAANIDCIVAPYEADAQLAYLNISGMAHFVITEDSDLLLFGSTKVVFKLDIGGGGILVEQEMLPVAMKMRPEEFTLDKFRQMCVLSGCDYLPSLPGIGLTKAFKFVKLTSQSDISKILHKIGSYLNMPNLTVPDDYKHNFMQAMYMFMHQPAFDPVQRKVVPLTPIEKGVDIILPKAHPPDVAFQLALGNIDPISMKVVDNWDPETQLKDAMIEKSIWSRNYRKPSPLPPSRVPKMAPAVNSTFGKRVSISTEDIVEQVAQNIKSDEAIVDEMREVWGVAKKRRLDMLEEDETLVSVEELVGPSPPKLNPFRVGTLNNSGNIQLTNSTTLSRLTSPSKALSKFCSPKSSSSTMLILKSSFSKFSSTPNSVERKAPTVVSRYFSSMSTSAEPLETSSNPDVKQCSTAEKGDESVVVVPETPEKVTNIPIKETTPKPIKRNIFMIPPSKPLEAEESESCSDTVFKDDSDQEIKSTLNVISDNKIHKSILSTIEDDDESNYKSLDSGLKKSHKNSLSNFKWKPLVLGNNLVSSKNDLLKSYDNSLLETPPNSQETEVSSMPKLPSYLEPPRSVRSMKNQSPAMQNFLSKFKYQPKTKIKTKR